MIAGFSGHLISEQFLEQRLADVRGQTSAESFAAELGRCRRGQLLLGPASSLRALTDAAATLFVNALGFQSLSDVAFFDHAAVATVRADHAHAAVVVTHWGERLDPLWRLAIVEARRRGAAWCLLFNGIRIRVISASRAFSRRFAEFDLDCAADDEKTAMGMWMVIAAPALAHGATPDAASSLDDFVMSSDRHASAVCRSLRDGVLAASEHVLQALVASPHKQSVNEAFEQALTIVYRMLFLFFAEGRSLVPSWHPIYRSSYSLERLADEAGRHAPVGLWDALRAVTRLAHTGCRAGDLRVTPFNGRLFAPSRTPLAERRDLDDDRARRSLIALASRPAADGDGREPIAYRDLGVEQLGAVYETLLDYVPRMHGVPNERGRTDTVVELQAGSGVRKATGTFYTPQPIAAYLVRETLEPLVRERTPEQILTLKVLDPSMGSGAFLVAACAYLADAYEANLVRDGQCHASDFGPRERASIRRLIAERCLYGVDLNPMAVQLARLSLWLATLAADRPLSFLDHHLQAGNSVLGAWLSCLRRPPAGRRRQPQALPLFQDLPIAETLREALPLRFSLANEPNDTPDQVRAKERTLTALSDRRTALSRWKRIADLWCARWFASELSAAAGVFAALSDEILGHASTLPRAATDRFLRVAESAAGAHQFFHWELEFPEVFFDATGERKPEGGFDVIIGNPPWDMVRVDQNKDSHEGTRARTDAAAIVRFTRDAGVYEAQSDGHANFYQLFLERSLALAKPGGRIGLVLPSGLATDQGSARLRRHLFSRCDVDALIGFENKRAIFPIHRSVRFLLLTGTAGAATRSIGCRFGESDPSILEPGGVDANRESWFSLRMSPTLLQRLSGDDLSVPDLRSRVDLAIVERSVALFPALGSETGWAARFGRELNATDDRGSLVEGGRGLPVVEGKLIEPHRVLLNRAKLSISQREARRLLGDRHRRWRLAYRDVASATNRLTLIAALMPPGVASTHTVFCLRTNLPLHAQRFLCGMFNSLVVNFLVRLRVTTHVTTAIVERLPIPREGDAGPAYDQIQAIARALSRSDDPRLQSVLQATVAKLYQLTDDEFAHVLGTFPLIPKEDRDRAMTEFSRM